MNVARSTNRIPPSAVDRSGAQSRQQLPFEARTTHAPPSQHEQLVRQTQTWVAQTFFGTMLKQMRESPFKSDLFSGGRGGQAFSSMYDQQLAERMARGAGAKLVNSIVHQIESKAAAVRQRVNPAATRVNATSSGNAGRKAA